MLPANISPAVNASQASWVNLSASYNTPWVDLYSDNAPVCSAQEGIPLACSGGLSTIIVEATNDTRDAQLVFKLPISSTIPTTEGIYISINLFRWVDNKRYAIVNILDQYRRVLETCWPAPDALQNNNNGFTRLNVGLNANPFDPQQENTTFVNWIKLDPANPCVLWYKDQGQATTATLPVGGIGGQGKTASTSGPVSEFTALGAGGAW